MASEQRLRQQLRKAIQDSGQSLNQLGQAAGMDSARLSRFMRGERDLTLEAVDRLCDVLGLEFCLRDKSPTGEPTPRRRRGTAAEGKRAKRTRKK